MSFRTKLLAFFTADDRRGGDAGGLGRVGVHAARVRGI